MKLFDLVLKEYFAIVEYLIRKVPTSNGKLIINAKTFYTLLDSNLYIKRNEKLEIYKNLNLILCNSNGLTSVVYDKLTKKTSRKIIVNYNSYEILKKLWETEFTI